MNFNTTFNKVLNSTEALNIVKSLTRFDISSCKYTIQHAAAVLNNSAAWQVQEAQGVATADRPLFNTTPLMIQMQPTAGSAGSR